MVGYENRSSGASLGAAIKQPVDENAEVRLIFAVVQADSQALFRLALADHEEPIVEIGSGGFENVSRALSGQICEVHCVLEILPSLVVYGVPDDIAGVEVPRRLLVPAQAKAGVGLVGQAPLASEGEHG